MAEVPTALPTTDHPSTQELATLFGRHTIELDWVLLQEGVKFRYQLRKIAKNEEAPILSPGGEI